MQSIIENFRSALRSLSSSWLRTALTMLGILIGVGSVGLLISIALGVQKQVTEEVQNLGVNLVFVVPGKLDENMQANPLAMLGVSTLKDRDVQALSRMESVAEVAPLLERLRGVDAAFADRVGRLVPRAVELLAVRNSGPARRPEAPVEDTAQPRPLLGVLDAPDLPADDRLGRLRDCSDRRSNSHDI